MTALKAGLVRLSARMRADHCFLDSADDCWCLADYVPGRATAANHVNQLIGNLKCRPSIARIDARRRYYKREAIAAIARALRAAVSRSWVECATWIPIPTSRPAPDADYDDRLQRILHQAFGDYALDLRAVLHQRQVSAPDHASARRLSVATLDQLLGLDRALLLSAPVRQRIVLFDDVLTTGKHYKCCERVLRQALAQVPILGLFVARRVLHRRRGCPRPACHAGSARTLTGR